MELEKELQDAIYETAKWVIEAFENGNGWSYTLMVLKTEGDNVGIAIKDQGNEYSFGIVDVEQIFSICPDFTETVMQDGKTGGYMQFTEDCKTMLRKTTFTVA